MSCGGISMLNCSSFVVVLLLTATVFAFALLSRKRTSKSAPPGPPALPFLGHLHLLAGAAHPALVLAKLSGRYGPLMSIKLGAVSVVVASTPDAAREILQTHDQAFAYRAPLAAAKAIYGDCPGIGFADHGPNLKFIRQLCATHLFSSRQLQRYKPIREEERKKLLMSIFLEAHGLAGNEARRVDKSASRVVGCGVPVHLLPHLQAATNNIISRMTVGDQSDLLQQLAVEVTNSVSAVNLGEFLPWLRWADLQGCEKRCRRVGLRVHAALQDMIDLRRAQRAGVHDPPADILDMLLSASLASPPDVDLSDARIRAMVLDVLAGGTDTTGTILEWAMAELLANTSKMKAAEDEISSVLSSKEGQDQCLDEDDIQNMPYLRAVMKETMRLHPIIPFLIPREARKACNIYGHHIPAKTLAFVNAWAIGRDPTVWENPEDFIPERFLETDIDVRGRHFELLPFGSGRRGCIGQNLAVLTFQLILGQLLYAFSWTPADLEHDLSGYCGFLMGKAKPLLTFATPKLPTEFYMA